MNKNRRIAVIGSGISGAICAWLLREHADVCLFEAAARFGGHTHTVVDHTPTGPVAIDTGFMVFNRANYPLLSALFDELGVATHPTSMSFAASFDGGALEWAGTDLNGLFGQRRNLVRPAFWRMLNGIVRFNRIARDSLSQPVDARLTVAGFLDRHGLDDAFRTRYLYPMAAAIWSCPQASVARFPAQSFLRFFANHGLIQLAGRPQWLTVYGGASTYMKRLIADLGGRARVACPVTRVERRDDGVELVFDDGQRAAFDEVVLACHSDQALRLLADPGSSERRVLAAIPYQPNRVFLHRDPALMPRARRVWSSWNYLSAGADDGVGAQAVSVTYWMNSLQRLATRDDYFVSLNPLREPHPERVVGEYCYEHPVFTAEALQAQRALPQIQGRRHTWFAGAWTGYGFHEDGMRSGVEVATALGAAVPWQAEMTASRTLAQGAARPLGQAA
ncbi:MAG TPA: FAD-dependent oxidoreductase [Gammaproteobacteria bacterium]|nr:FAD-dependent oxidoreductase [Gammaproteobacteria bacterium]